MKKDRFIGFRKAFSQKHAKKFDIFQKIAILSPTTIRDWPSGKATDSESVIRGFESLIPSHPYPHKTMSVVRIWSFLLKISEKRENPTKISASRSSYESCTPRYDARFSSFLRNFTFRNPTLKFFPCP